MEKHTFTFAMELLYGCMHDCSGCLANKTEKRIPTPDEFAYLYDLMGELSEFYIIKELEVAPTDFLSSMNGHELLTNPGMLKLFTQFKNIEINTTLLAPRREDYKRLADAVNTLKPNGGIGLIVPFEIKQIHNEKYIDTFRRHIQWFEEELGRPIPDFEITITVGFDALVSFNYLGAIDKLYELYDTFMRTRIHPHASYHFNISNKRDFLTRPHDMKEARKVLTILNRLFQKDLELHPTGWREDDSKGYRAHINPLKKAYHYAGPEMFWSDGKLYHVPAIYKNIELESSIYEFKGTTGREYHEFHQQLMLDSMDKSSLIPDCASCQNIIECGWKTTHLMAEAMGINKCIFGRSV